MVVELRVIRNGAVNAERPVHRNPRIVDPLEAVVALSIDQLWRREWDSLFPGEIEDWDYLRALERARLDGCEPIYFAIRCGGRLVAATPGFVGRRALAEPWRTRGRAQWRRAPERALVLGSPFGAACRIGFAPRSTAGEQALLVERLLQTARAEAVRRGLEGVVVSGDDAAVGDISQRAESLRLARARGAPTARISLPRWSLSDYLSSFEEGLRGRLLRVCAQAAQYERDWHVVLDRDIEPMLALCREAGLEEINEAFFKSLLASSTLSASGLLVRRGDGKLAGFSIVLDGMGALREKLTVVNRREKGALVRGVIWLETLRFCLERGFGSYESASELSLSAARPSELSQGSRWIATEQRAPSHPLGRYGSANANSELPAATVTYCLPPTE
jgi:uncharacterized protein